MPASRARAAAGALLGIGFFLVEALAAGAASQPAPASSGEPEQDDRPSFAEWTALIDRHRGAVEEEQSRNGPRSRDLIDLLMELGLLEQEVGLHSQAVETIGRALQVQRVNDGLSTLEQVPMIRHLIESEVARGNFAAAAELENRMVELARLYPDDSRSIEIFSESADRWLAAYERYMEGGRGAPAELTVNVSAFGSGRQAPDPETFILRQARRNYMDAIRGILRGGFYANEELPELERALIRTYYLEVAAEDILPYHQQRLYRLGRESHRRLVVYTAARSGAAADFARALVELADWDLLFSRNGKALKQYAEAYDVLVKENVPDESIREIFSPETPVILPAFLPNPLASGAPAEPAGYIDVAFELSRYGTSRKIRIIDTSDDAVEAFDGDVVRLIAGNRFRPRVADGALGQPAPYSVRYYVTHTMQ